MRALVNLRLGTLGAQESSTKVQTMVQQNKPLAFSPLTAPRVLVEPLAPRWLWLVAGLALAAGASLAQSVAAAPEIKQADVAFRLAALAALPLPAILLQWLSLPVHGPARRWMGESAGLQVDRTLAYSRRALVAALAFPVGIASACLWSPVGSWDHNPLLLAALLSALAQVLAHGLGAIALLMALGAMAGSTKDLWQTMSGGGAFGPAEAAPLLYAPAAALVVALVPVAVLSAVWGARAQLLSVPVAAAVVVACAVAVAGALRGVRQGVAPLLHRALLKVEAAHQAPFAEQLLLPASPGWLNWTTPHHPAGRWLSLAWARQRPTSLAATGGLAVLGAVLATPQASATALAGLGASIGLYSAVRAAIQDGEPALGCAQWLGATPEQVHIGQQKLALALATPALLAGLAGWVAAVGAMLGAGLGWLLMGVPAQRLPAPAWVVVGERTLWPRLALLVYGAALAMVGS